MSSKPTLASFFEEMCRDIKNFQGVTEQIAKDMRDPARRQRVGVLLREFQRIFAEVEVAVPRAITALDERHAAEVAKLRDCAAKAQELRQKLEELKKARATGKPAQPTPAIDPNHGAILRQEVLQRFADRGTERGPSPAATQTAGDVASMSSGNWEGPSGSREAPADPAARAPRKGDRRPNAKPGEDVADIQSDVWKDEET